MAVRARVARHRSIILFLVWGTCLTLPDRAAAQQSITQVLSFLLTNRSIATDDFVRDELAAAATRDAVSTFLVTELGTLPISSSGSGFTYRFNPAIGSAERSSDSFGPFLAERALPTGRHQVSFGIGYQRTTFDAIDGRALRDGTIVATASQLSGEARPFDVETLSLKLTTSTATLSARWGWTDRFELGAALPLVRVSLGGERVDTYRGQALVQATAAAVAAGLGDLVLRAKYSLASSGGSGIAIAGDLKLASGDAENLLGTGHTTFAPRVIASLERSRVAVHGAAAYAFGAAGEFDYGTAVTVVADPRLTVVGELTGRRLSSGRLTEVRTPHPTLASVTTTRLTSEVRPTERLIAVVGIKWNVTATWLMSASVMRPLTSAGLNARWVPMVTFDVSFGR